MGFLENLDFNEEKLRWQGVCSPPQPGFEGLHWEPRGKKRSPLHFPSTVTHLMAASPQASFLRPLLCSVFPLSSGPGTPDWCLKSYVWTSWAWSQMGPEPPASESNHHLPALRFRQGVSPPITSSGGPMVSVSFLVRLFLPSPLTKGWVTVHQALTPLHPHTACTH